MFTVIQHICTSINPVFNMQIVSSVLKRIIVSDALPCDKCIFCVPHNQPFSRKIIEFKISPILIYVEWKI